MALDGLKADFGDKMTFFGCVDTQALIEGTKEEARQLTRQTLDTMMPGGGFIASPSHDYLLPETPVENVIVMYETIKEWGGTVRSRRMETSQECPIASTTNDTNPSRRHPCNDSVN